MNTTKETAHFFWHGSPLSIYERECISSFVKHNWNVHLWSFNDVVVPDGVVLKDANKFYSVEDIQTFVQKKKVGCISAFSDAFRYKLLKSEGGWWFDTDCICLKDQQEFFKLRQSRKIVAGYERKEMVAAGVLFFNNEIIINDTLTTLENILHQRNRRVGWGEIGPRLVNSIVEKHSLQKDILPPNYFYPVKCKSADIALDPNFTNELIQLTENSYIYHYWGEILNRNNVDRNIPPPDGSFLRKLFFNE